MKKLTLTIIIFMLITTLVYAQYPGIRDTIKIETVYITPPADSIVVGISLFTDNFDSIAFYNTPYIFTATTDAINFERVEYHYPLSNWDENYFEYLEDETFLRIYGYKDIDSTIPPWPLPRYYHLWDLIFSVEPYAEHEIIFINSISDPIMGPIVLGKIDWMSEYYPYFIPGVVEYGAMLEIDDNKISPDAFLISNCYPNPFNASTTIEFSLSESSNVRIEIYDILGQKITVLLKGQLEAGQYKETWDASPVKSGMYFVRLSAEKYSDTKKLILLK